jgi:hypothetical protein
LPKGPGLPKFLLWIRADIADDESSRKWNETAAKRLTKKEGDPGGVLTLEHELLIYYKRHISREASPRHMDHGWIIPKS